MCVVICNVLINHEGAYIPKPIDIRDVYEWDVNRVVWYDAWSQWQLMKYAHCVLALGCRTFHDAGCMNISKTLNGTVWTLLLTVRYPGHSNSRPFSAGPKRDRPDEEPPESPDSATTSMRHDEPSRRLDGKPTNISLTGYQHLIAGFSMAHLLGVCIWHPCS